MDAVASAIARLAALDPAGWGTGLSDANARACWAAAVGDLDPAALTADVAGTRPRAVLIVCSSNVYTAALPWMLHLAARGVRVIVKPASGQEAAIEAMATAIGDLGDGRIEVRSWRGGELAAEADALAEVDGVMAFGGAAAMSAIRTRLPEGVVWLPFGPRFGVGVVSALTEAAIDDVALYDGHGCMSPAAYFTRHVDLDAAAAWMAAAEARWPRGVVDPADAAQTRARIMLARAAGRKVVGAGWAVLELPADHFTPVALPRVLVLHPFADVEEVRTAVAPWRDRLGTVATDLPGLYLGAPRMCGPGGMQHPACGRFHDGVDVLGALWRQRVPRPDGTA
ncbi:MAG: acyl-CoA reductase [Pseudomonadota bacterium]|nr:acyl-CoA reductase [Pseudomonadota bacterium]